MLKKELFFFYKKNMKICVLFFMQITVLMMLISTFSSFLSDLNYEQEAMKSIYEGKAMYQLIDKYADGAKFHQFVSREEALPVLKAFYTGLKNAKHFEYLTISNQHVLISNATIPPQMALGYEQGKEPREDLMGDKVFRRIKALQMNAETLQHFAIVPSEGTLFSNFNDNEQEIVPVLLGDGYSGVYSLGDVFRMNYLQKDLDCKVVGFFKPSTTIYHRSTPEFYLDNYIVMPVFENESAPTNQSEEMFQIPSYLNMINGYLYVDDTPDTIQAMMVEVETIAKQAGFEGGYSYIGMNPQAQQYNNIKVVLDKNQSLIQRLFWVFCLLNILVVGMVSYLQSQNQRPKYSVLLACGASRRFIFSLKLFEISGIVLCAFIAQYWIVDRVLKLGNIFSYFAPMPLGIFLILAYTLVGTHTLTRTDSIKQSDSL